MPELPNQDTCRLVVVDAAPACRQSRRTDFCKDCNGLASNVKGPLLMGAVASAPLAVVLGDVGQGELAHRLG